MVCNGHGPGYLGGTDCVGYEANWFEYGLVNWLYDGGCCWGGYGAVAILCCCDDGCGCSFRGGCDTGGLGLM